MDYLRYKFRIYPTKRQEVLIQKTFGCCRFVYNYFLAERKKAWEERQETLNFYACSKLLTVLKQENEWLREPDKSALQNSLRDLDKAYKNFFRRIKNGETISSPKFKNKRNNHRTYRTSNTNNDKAIMFMENSVKLPKLGRIKCKITKLANSRIVNAVIVQKPSGKYFVSILFENIEKQPKPKTNKQVGIDVGVKTLATLSDGTKYENHKYLHKSEKRLKRLQRQLSRKSKDSNRREKARIAVAKLHEHIANQRNDTLHKVTTEIVRNYDLICVEDLKVQDMIETAKFKRIRKSMSDTAMGEFLRQITYKAERYGRTLIKVGKDYPSTQICYCCGQQNETLKDMAIRKWTCPKCGTTHDRDMNAAKNILKEGLRLLTA